MTTPGRRGGALLAGLAAGALAIGGIATAAPGGLPVQLTGALGPPPAAAPAVPAVVDVRVPVPLPDLPRLPRIPPLLPQPTSPTPSPDPAPEPEPDDAPPVDQGPTAAVVALTNAERAAAGCGPLAPEGRIAAAARAHSEDMAEQRYFSHTGLDGDSFADRIRAAGFGSPGGENIARGQGSADEVVAAWMDSPGHRANILNCEFATVGVGFDPRGEFWTQNFGY